MHGGRQLQLGISAILTVLLVSVVPVQPARADVTVGGGSADFLLKTYDPSGQQGPPLQDIYDTASGWDGGANDTGGILTQTPAVTSYNGQFWVIGLGGDQQLYYDYYNPSTSSWSGWAGIPGSLPAGSYPFTSAASVAVYLGYLEVFVRGSNNGLWQASYANGTWSGWYSFTAANTAGSAPAITTFTGSGERNEFHVAWLGYGSNTIYDEVYNKYGGSAGWNPAVALPGAYTSAPALAPYGSSLQMWADGLNYEVYQSIYNYGGAQSWQLFPPYSSDVAGSAPAVTEYDAGSDAQFQVFYVMGDSSGTWDTHQLAYDPSAGGWQQPTRWGVLSSAPAAAQFSGQLQLWSRDPAEIGKGATTCPHGYNKADTACLNGAQGETYTEAEAVWADNNFNLSWDTGEYRRFISNVMWTYTSLNGNYQVEIGNLYGTCYGFYGFADEKNPVDICPQGTDITQPHAYRYWADFIPNHQWVHWLGWWTMNTGQQHQYAIQRDPNNACYWKILFDAVPTNPAVSTTQYCRNGQSLMHAVQVGLEANANTIYSDQYYSNTVSDEQLKTYQSSEVPWGYQNHWIDDQCKSGITTNCFNGTNDGNNTIWRVNRPWQYGP